MCSAWKVKVLCPTLSSECLYVIVVFDFYTNLNSNENQLKNFNIFFYYFLPALMSKMVQEEHVHPWRVDHQVLVLYYKIFHNVVNHFYIDLILILRCHRSRCREIQVLLVKGKILNLFLLL